MIISGRGMGMKRPFIWFFAGLAAGILSAVYKNIGIAVVVALTAISVLSALKNRQAEYMLVPVFAVIGILLCNCAIAPKDSRAERMKNRNVTVRGTVREWHSTEDNTVITLDAEYIRCDGIGTSGKVRLCVYADSDVNVSAGEIIDLEGRLYGFSEPTNPYQTDYRLYMRSKGFDYSMSCNALIQTGRRNSGIIYRIEGIREYVNGFFDKYLPESRAGVAKALTTGYKYDIDDDTRTLFRNMGLSHALAVSGLHVSAIAGLIFIVFTKLLGLKKRRTIPVVSVLLVLYLAFTGFSPSAVRAVVMALTAYAALMLYKNSDMLNTIAFSAFCMLMVQPLYLWNVSFVLSYTGITAVAFAMDITERLERGKRLAKTIIFSTVVWVLTTPAVMYYFGGISPVSVLLNIIAVPYLSMVTVLSLAAGLMSFTPIGPTAARLVGSAIGLYETAAGMFINEGLYVETAKPSAAAIIVFYIITMTAIAYRNRKYTLRISAAALAAFTVITAAVNINRPAEAVFFDAGQGDASIIYVPNGITAVIDGGPDGGAERSVIPYLQAKGVKADILFITHMDNDHSSGALELIKRNMVGMAVVSDTIHSDKIREIEKAAEENGIQVFYASEGDVFEAENFRIECLYPYQGISAEENSTSFVLSAEIDGTKILFTGDIEAEDEKYLLNSDIECDIIKIAHHGSNTSSTEEFLETAKAKTAVIEAAENNIYGFPHSEVIARLLKDGTDIYVTGRDGAITVKIDKDGYSVKTYR